MKCRKIEYDNDTIMSLDTETTSIESEKLSFMYICAIAIGNINDETPTSYYFKTWYGVKEFLDSDKFPKNKTYVCYVHNLSFEFQFMKSYFEFTNVFARDEHKIMKCTYKNIEFRCSLFLSNCKLSTLAKNENLPVKKMVGDLDYRKIRHSETYLTDIECKYVRNDIWVVWYYVKKKLLQYGTYSELPLTSTGEIRYMFRQHLFSDEKTKQKIRFCVKNYSANSEHLQNKMHAAYLGAYTHANWLHANKKITEKMGCVDISSSYPFQMVSQKFPTKWFKLADDKITWNDFMRYVNDEYAVLATVTIKNMKSKSTHSIFSRNKCIKISDDAEIIDNGRIRKCAMCQFELNEIDIQLINDYYNFEKILITDVYVSKKQYLPSEIVEIILELFAEKTRLKGVREEIENYMRKKAYVNGVYGTTVFNPLDVEYEYNNETKSFSTKNKTFEDFEKYIKNPKTYLWYSIGVWVTSYGRKQLMTLMQKMGENACYSDTDSIKFLRPARYAKIIQHENAKIKTQFYTAMEYHHFSDDKINFFDKNGKQHYLGTFEFEPECTEFKTLGSKCYMYTSNDFVEYTYLVNNNEIKCKSNLHTTVAGAPKNLSQYLLLFHFPFFCKPYNFFENGLQISQCKNCHTYHDNEKINTEIKDYEGKTASVEIASGVCIYPTTFSLKTNKIISETLFYSDIPIEKITKYL